MIRSATYMEAISAIDTITKPMPIAVPRKTNIAPPVPPFVKGMIRVLMTCQLVLVGKMGSTHVKAVSHVAIKIIEYPKMDTKRKFLRSFLVIGCSLLLRDYRKFLRFAIARLNISLRFAV